MANLLCEPSFGVNLVDGTAAVAQRVSRTLRRNYSCQPSGKLRSTIICVNYFGALVGVGELAPSRSQLWTP
jgi:hypothetical protein